MADLTLEITAEPAGEDADAVLSGLALFNVDAVGPSNRTALAVFAREEGAEVAGGLIGYTAWSWLFVGNLWVGEAFRRRGLAGRLLDEAEAEARRRGCKAAWIDTFNPEARRAYERAGYAVFGELPQFVAGRSRFFLRKSLLSNDPNF